MLWVLKPRITTVELWAPTLPPVPPSKGMNAANKTTCCSTSSLAAITSEVKKLASTSTASHTTRRRATVNRLLLK